MLKKSITYTDYDGTKKTEDFYFNLTKAELLEMEISEEGGFNDNIKKIVASNKPKEIIALFKEIIKSAYGIRSEDGKSFLKSEEISRGFAGTEAFSELFFELATDAAAGAAFVNGVVPSEMALTAQQIEKATQEVTDKAKSSSETARENSEKLLQDRKPKQVESKDPTIEVVPDIPTVTQVQTVEPQKLLTPEEMAALPHDELVRRLAEQQQGSGFVATRDME